jgi:PAS domain S-box-containing protein
MQSELFESAFKFASIGMALVSPEGKWLKVNDAAITLFGYSEEELLSIDFRQITHPEDLKADLDLVNDLLSGRSETYQMEKRYIHKDGQLVYAFLSVSLIRNPDGTPRFFISQIQNITELKKIQQNLQNHTKMVALGEMAAGIAHEINNPLTIIDLHATALEHLVNDAVVDRVMLKQFTGKITDTSKRISCIVSGLRKFSNDIIKLEAFEEYNLKAIVSDALGRCTEKFKKHGISLISNVPDDLMLDCNPVDISQVLTNLINNAFHAIKDHSEKEISIAAAVSGDFITISVMDSGPGIPLEIKTRLLETLFTMKPFGDGTGLGLSISKSIVKVHNGELFLDDTSSRTNFVVKLPRCQAYFNKRSEASRTASNIFPI